MSAAKNSVHPLVRFAHVGSTIETVFSDGRRTRVTVNTPIACAEANSLIMSGRWHVVDKPNSLLDRNDLPNAEQSTQKQKGKESHTTRLTTHA